MDQIKEATMIPREAMIMEGDFSRTKLLVLDSDGWKSTIKQNVKAL